jgi:amidohydrolase
VVIFLDVAAVAGAFAAPFIFHVFTPTQSWIKEPAQRTIRSGRIRARIARHGAMVQHHRHRIMNFIPHCVAIFVLASLAICATSVRAAPPAWLDRDAEGLLAEVTRLRRDFHEHPELSNTEERTAGIVAERLRELGLDVRTGIAKHGVVGLLRGGKPGGCVALRADMDALPIQETGDLPFKSQQPNVMHACGHDAHTAIALGVAALLSKHRDELAGTVKFLFQPAEEGMPVHYTAEWGAKLMVAEGALENPAPSAVFALHCSPSAMIVDPAGRRRETVMRAGQLGYAIGPISANSDRFAINVHGKMAHGSAPQRGTDAIQVAAAIVTELQTIRSRHTDTQDPLVISVGMIRGGQRENIIAEQAEMTGTVRTHDTRVQERVITLMNQIAKNIAAAHDATVEVTYRKGYPASINDSALTRRMRPLLETIVGKENVVDMQPSMGGEDFAYFAEKIPGCYLRLGVTRDGVTAPAGLHTAEFELDERALLVGMRAMAALLVESLRSP